MLSNLDPSAQQFLNNLNRIQERMSHAQREITTGRRVNQVSDDPDQIYWESQNGGMGSTNLRTTDRGFIRPPAGTGRVERGSA